MVIKVSMLSIYDVYDPIDKYIDPVAAWADVEVSEDEKAQA